jgi:DNA-binding NarL/FixJ family response regulator
MIRKMAEAAIGKLRILLADDHETIREGLKAILNAQPDMQVVGEANDGSAIVDQARELRPDIVVMDVSMPRVNGLKATEALKQCCPGVKVVALTRHFDDGYVQQLLRAGADGYALKQSRATELLRGLRAVASGGKYLDPAVTSRLRDELGQPSEPDSEGASRLSPREDEILRLVAWGYSHKEIASQLDRSVKTVETHKTNAMRKLGLHSRIDIVRFALLEGWLDET